MPFDVFWAGKVIRIMAKPFTIQELYELPAAVDLMTAARALNMGRTMAYELAKKGEFPCRVIHYGSSYRIPVVEIYAFLGVPAPRKMDTESDETV